ncbi:MAG: tRNA glutamyl-Q(34) synthetase GluQRS [Luteolibacter sp.]
MSRCTRFAPSPTGKLHLGHALAARVAYELAHSAPGGRFLLRFEDIDSTRVRDPFYLQIEEDLRWLGFMWDGQPLRQKDRGAAYAAAMEDLKSQGLVYPCFCTRREIRDAGSRIAEAPHDATSPRYPGSCRQHSQRQRDEWIEAGVPHAWRLDIDAASKRVGRLRFHDLRLGRIEVDSSLHDDVILARKDIGTAYHLAVVVDDAYQNITHVTRGEDLLAATHVHRLLQALLGLPEPIYLHHPLVKDSEGRRLAKRHDSLSIAAMRDAGHDRIQVLARIAEIA